MSKYEIKNKNRFSVHSIKIPQEYNGQDFDRFLKQSSSRLQEYFNMLGVIIDLEHIKRNDNFESIISEIVEILKDNKFIVSGFSNIKDSQKKWLNETFNISIFHETSAQDENPSEPKIIEKIVEVEKIIEVEKVVEIEKTIENEYISQGVEVYEGIIRGGQRVYAQNKDLLVIGDVKPNGEIIADGNIIVLGKLNGKAIAGATGNEDALITAKEFNASMISIAGNYRQFEEDSASYGINVKLLIRDSKLIIEKY